MVNMNDVLEQFKGTVIEGQEDKDLTITPLDGRYKAEIKKFELVEMKDESNFFSMNLCITETISGVPGNGRYASKNYSNGDTQYGTAAENMEKLLQGLASMAIDKGSSWDELVANCKAATGKTINVKLRPQKSKGEVKTDDKGWPKHFVTIVKEFDLTNVKGGVVETKPNANVPF